MFDKEEKNTGKQIIVNGFRYHHVHTKNHLSIVMLNILFFENRNTFL